MIRAHSDAPPVSFFVDESLGRCSYRHAISPMAGILLVFVVAAILVNTGDIALDFDVHA